MSKKDYYTISKNVEKIIQEKIYKKIILVEVEQLCHFFSLIPEHFELVLQEDRDLDYYFLAILFCFQERHSLLLRNLTLFPKVQLLCLAMPKKEHHVRH